MNDTLNVEGLSQEKSANNPRYVIQRSSSKRVDYRVSSYCRIISEISCEKT